MIKEIKNSLIKKEYSCCELITQTFDKILKEDRKINAFISLRKDDALKEAKAVDEKIQRQENLNILEGIPFGIKDNILVQGLRVTAGSKILEDYIGPLDATAIKKIKKEGGIIIGKTNLDEFAMGSSNETSAFGSVHNPHSLDKVSGGSSGGSAAAVASDFISAALGSDTAGSVRQPASFCGVVGFKPTYGAISRFGLIAMASSLDVIGILAKSVEDVELIFRSIRGRDEYDATSVDVPDFKGAIDFKNLIIGVPKEYFTNGIDEEVLAAIKKVISQLEKEGTKIQEINLQTTKYCLPCYHIIMPAEVSANLARYDNVRYGSRFLELQNQLGISSLRDLYFKTRGKKLGKEVKRRILLGTYVLSKGYYDAYYNRAQKVRSIICDDFNDAFHKVDFILTPTTPTTAFGFGEKTKDPVAMYLSDILTVSANLAGIPAISLPLSRDSHNLPIGLQLIGKSLDDSRLLEASKLLENLINYQ